ncbi:hypothetical protein [Streptosporangium canum]|uniref:hypothetical protein n=1 Tax=Streptosporangium canum TaxID=324952 RepID=UPI0037A3A89E
MIPRLLADRATVAVLAGAVYGLLPVAGALASAVTRIWQPLAQAARASGDGTAALAALEQMTEADLATLLDDALDHWAVGGADSVPVLLDLTDDDAEDELPVSYVLYPGTVASPGGPLPTLVLASETPGAGVDDIRARCASNGWRPWDLTALPEVDPQWRIRADIASRSIEEIAHVDAEGWDDVTLWQAPEPILLPGQWRILLDRVQHVLVCGPAADGCTWPAGW